MVGPRVSPPVQRGLAQYIVSPEGSQESSTISIKRRSMYYGTTHHFFAPVCRLSSVNLIFIYLFFISIYLILFVVDRSNLHFVNGDKLVNKKTIRKVLW